MFLQINTPAYRNKPALVVASSGMTICGVMLLRKRPGPDGDYTSAIYIGPGIVNTHFNGVALITGQPEKLGYFWFLWLWHIVILRKQHVWIDSEMKS